MAIRHDFQDLAVLVTGAGRGLGRSVAEKLASCGATVGLIDIDAATCEAAAALIRRRLQASLQRSAAASTPW